MHPHHPRPGSGSSELFDTLEPRKLLATFTVTSDADSGAGSLRQAVIDANAAAGADVIEFDDGLRSGTIGLTTGQIVIASDLTIRGSDASGSPLGLTISGNASSRIFLVTDGSDSNDVSVVVEDLALSHGRVTGFLEAAGGILNFESLTLNRVAVNSHQSTGPGGALANQGSVTIRDSSFWSNQSGDNGGALYNVGRAGGSTMTIINSTIHANMATGFAGAIWQNAAGQIAALNIFNSTISSNIANSDNTGGEYGGGIQADGTTGTIKLISTLVAGNQAGSSPDEISVTGGTTIDPETSNNLVQDAGRADGFVDGSDGNIVGHDPLLGSLTSTSGERFVMPLLTGSPAINSGLNPQSLANDSRGAVFERVADGAADIGAYEVQRLSLTVDNGHIFQDGRYGPGFLTLTEAISLTNTNPGDDTITIDLDGNTVGLTSPLNILDDLTLIGPGSGRFTLDGNGVTRIFTSANHSSGAPTSITVRGLRLVNGQATEAGAWRNTADSLFLHDIRFENNSATSWRGGALYNLSGTTTITDSVFSGNMALEGGGAIFNLDGASLAITDSTLSNNTALFGGGIANAGTLTISRSTISDNQSMQNGGGVDSWGPTLSIESSTISGNSAGHADSGSVYTGGGIQFVNGSGSIVASTISGNSATFSNGWGGGIAVSGSTAILQVERSTVSGNNAWGAGGGILQWTSGGILTIVGSTIAFNQAVTTDGVGAVGGGIAYGTLTTLDSTIVSGNTRGSANTPDDLSSYGGTIGATSSNNLIGDSATAGGLIDGTKGNIVGQDPMLESLAANGGLTRTHALPANSPAIDTGAAGTQAADQRGVLFSRAFGGAADIGAYERQVLALVVDSIESTDDGDVSAGDISLREAILASNGNPLDDSITFDASLSGSTITLTGGFITISDDVTIVGPGFNDLTISGNDASRHFVVSDSSPSSVINVTISGLTLTNGMTTANGGAITNDENLTLDTMKIVRNTSANDGGAIINRNTLTIINTIISYNTSGDSGGAIDNDGATTVTIRGSSIKNNAAGGAAGAIDNDANGTLTITSTSINDNRTESNGGAIDNGGTLNITGSTFAENFSMEEGGAIENSGTAMITDSTFTGNLSGESGGAIDNFGGILTIIGSLLSGNFANGSGGAIWTDTSLTIRSSTISDNAASAFGGGIGMFDGTVVIANSTIAFNSADYYSGGSGQGGAIDVGRRTGSGVLTTTSTIYAHNFVGAGHLRVASDITRSDGNVTGSNNLVTDTASAGGLANGTNGNIVGTDPNLGVLADNGGPTLTHAIFPGSVALNAGYASGGVTQDQRGLNRTYGSGPDIGAYEWAPTSNFSLAVLNGSRSQSTSITGDTHVTVIRNADGDLVAMTGNGSVWIAQRIRDYTPAPAVTSDPVVWTDPHDGLVYVAAPSAEGFILHRRAADGTWTFRNLSTEFSVSNADSPQGVLTFFVSRPRTGDALVSVAGITGSGEIVAFQQSTAASSNAEAAWTFYNITDDLNSQTGMTTPAFTQMTSYVTSWNQWTLAGLDANGNVQGVWVNVAQFTTWRVDNLSTITGADPLTGELDVTLTTWGGIRFSGADASGKLIATWWNPSLGGGNWKQTNLTSAVTGAGPTLSGGRLTAWFATGNLISYAGFSSGGDVLSYYWQPSDGATWNTDNLTEFVTDSSTRPTGAITAYVSTAGTVSIVAADSNSNLVRLWSPTGEENTFSLDNLSDIALRI